jgi:hypothetical protein
VLLAALPLTPSGKVNRRACLLRKDTTRIFRSHRDTPTEELLAAIWATVLGVASVGVEDNFFELEDIRCSRRASFHVSGKRFAVEFGHCVRCSSTRT